jgi:ArsR family transcriptional regulator, arsenate/arsenite/antimonite-responsive transcriptional repressor
MPVIKSKKSSGCCSLNISGKQQERLLKMAKALGNPLRFEILKFLLTHDGCINSDVVDFLPIAQATVSQHLKVLQEAGWVLGTQQGRVTSYCLNDKNIAWFRKIIGEIL